MNRSELVEHLLLTQGRFTMGQITREYPEMFYTIRNGVSEARPKLAAEGFAIRHINGKTWAENGYELVRVVDKNGQLVFA